MKAIILAAGIGSRLSSITKDLPKALIKLNDETLLERQLRMLEKSGFEKDDIIVVTGYKTEKIEEVAGSRAMIIYNQIYDKTNNIYSLFLGFEKIENKETVYILNADTIFETSLFEELLEANGSHMVVDNVRELDEEDMKVKVSDGKIVEVSKNIPINESYGEYIGIMKMSPEDLKIYKDAVRKAIDENLLSVWYEDVLNNVLHLCNISPLDTNGRNWAEIDNINDYENAKVLFKEGN